MDAMSQDGNKKKYKTPHWVQIWFLSRSRDNWKAKYKQRTAEAKRLKNHIYDVKRSRQNWEKQVDKLKNVAAPIHQINPDGSLWRTAHRFHAFGPQPALALRMFPRSLDAFLLVHLPPDLHDLAHQSQRLALLI